MSDRGEPAASSRATYIVKVGRRERRIEADSIIIGSRRSCDVVLEGPGGARHNKTHMLADPIAAPEHLRIEFDGEEFFVEDSGSATGTYLNGIPVEEKALLARGDRIIAGASRIELSKETGQETAQLTLRVEANRLVRFARDRRAGEIQSDADRWALSELRLGRLEPLRLGNAGGLLAAILLLAVTLSSDRVEESLVEPGPLGRRHAAVFDGPGETPGLGVGPAAVSSGTLLAARAEGCEACHDPWGGTPMTKCAGCHGAFMGEHHPFRSSAFPKALLAGNVSRGWKLGDCALCHVEHRGGGAPRASGFVPAVATVERMCEHCHAGSAVAARGYQAARAPLPVSLDREMIYLTFEFGHDDHIFNSRTGEAIDCGVCHVREADAADGVDERLEERVEAPDPDLREYSRVPYETCEKCHSSDARDPSLEAWWPRDPEGEPGRFEWTISWHGSEDASRCLACHVERYRPERGTVDRIELSAGEYDEHRARYRLRGRTHAEHFETHGKACADCHPRTSGLTGVTERVAFFSHAVHTTRGMAPTGAEEARELSRECLACHRDRERSKGLVSFSGSGFYQWAPASCGACHREESGSGAAANLRRPEPATDREIGKAATPVENFSHEPHLDFTRPALADGCFTCHEFEVAGGEPPITVPRTKPERRRCASAGCHEKHDNIAGGFCRKCHAMRDESIYNVYFGPSPPEDRPLARRPWPARNSFDHRSEGHRDQPCVDCHEVGSARAPAGLATAATLREVPVPHEGMAACRGCHLGKRQRFHWR